MVVIRDANWRNPTADLWLFERRAGERGYSRIAGVDEAGRGPLAGPVVAAAVMLPPDFPTDGIRDSKKLTPLKRDDAYERIMCEATAVGVGVCEPEEIDRINILQATYKAMLTAIAGLGMDVDYVLVDGRAIPQLQVAHEGIVRGDALSVSIAAASIVAKVTRDRQMIELDCRYPHWGFAKHKGYLTPEHLEAITRHGICKIHRKSFAPIREEEALECGQSSLF